jgi:hypothetical protein
LQGTGKTSICRALAHKLAIRHADRFPAAQLIEINAHSLFSRWFSESGKLVARLFGHIRELAEDEGALLILAIDEVESLTAARKAALSGSEPSDAVRVVNAVLTQLDALRTRPNVLVLTTSNITEAIDLAFVDRADVRAFIGNPSPRARYNIVTSCVAELLRAGVVLTPPPCPVPDSVPNAESVPAARGTTVGVTETLVLPWHPYAAAAALLPSAAPAGPCGAEERTSLQLLEVVRATAGSSGRALRKLPLQAFACWLHTGVRACGVGRGAHDSEDKGAACPARGSLKAPTLTQFLHCVLETARQEKAGRNAMRVRC